MPFAAAPVDSGAGVGTGITTGAVMAAAVAGLAGVAGGFFELPGSVCVVFAPALAVGLAAVALAGWAVEEAAGCAAPGEFGF